MSRRHRKQPKPRRVDGALIVIAPGPGVVARTKSAVGDAREVAEAKRAVERALRAAGLSKRQACIAVAGMARDDLLAEAARVQASEPVQAPEPAARGGQIKAQMCDLKSEPSARPWWRRIVDRWRQ